MILGFLPILDVKNLAYPVLSLWWMVIIDWLCFYLPLFLPSFLTPFPFGHQFGYASPSLFFPLCGDVLVQSSRSTVYF